LKDRFLFIERQITERKKKQDVEDETPIPRSEFKKVFERIEESSTHALSNGEGKILSRALSDIVSSLRALLTHTFKSGETDVLKELEQERDKIVKEKMEQEEALLETQKTEEKLTSEYNELRRVIESESTESREAEREVFALMNEERQIEQKIDVIDRELSQLERDRGEFKNELQEAVTLLGRGAGMYFEYVIVDSEGKELPREMVVEEDRMVQMNRRRELERMKIRLEELGTGSNEDVMKEYKEVKERDEFLAHEITDLTESVAKLESLIQDLTNDLNEQFVTGIEKIGTEFSKFFVLMFGGGGSAELLRVKPKVKKSEDDLAVTEEGGEEDEAEEGIEIDVKLPNKRVRGLDMLSGGERALTSIALIFAMSQVNPPLFVILDETDAALDEANSRRYGDMISALAEKSQLILITHNRETMGRAGVLYGVTMAGDGVSKLLSVKFDEAVAVAK
jgi:chromosome segregation protein